MLAFRLKEDVVSFKQHTATLRNIWFLMRLPITFDGTVYSFPAPSWRAEADAVLSAENDPKNRKRDIKITSVIVLGGFIYFFLTILLQL